MKIKKEIRSWNVKKSKKLYRSIRTKLKSNEGQWIKVLGELIKIYKLENVK